LLAAFIPSLEYVTVNAYFLPDGLFQPFVIYPLFGLSFHIMTFKLLAIAFGGLLGFFIILGPIRKYDIWVL